tara:strand:+ start:142 stop:1131 length:990 start_codon:yes stop_codon:yes gene_type:complete
MIAIDLAKDIFHLFGEIKQSGIKVDRALKRNKLLTFTANLPKTLIVMEACGGASYWNRRFTEQGHRVKIISPQHVKAFVGHQKNDRKDAMAIYQAVQKIGINFVAPKSIDQQDMQAQHRVRERYVKQKNMCSNQIRGILLEFGICIPVGVNYISKRVPEILEDADNELSLRTRALIQDLYEEFKQLAERVVNITKAIEVFTNQIEICRELQKLSGVGPLVASAFWMCVGKAGNFKNGRTLSAWVGLVPRQHSSGGKVKLMGITKRGDQYLRKLLVIAGRAQINASTRRMHKSEEDLKLLDFVDRKGSNKACVALANKLGRHMWAVMSAF